MLTEVTSTNLKCILNPMNPEEHTATSNPWLKTETRPWKSTVFFEGDISNWRQHNILMSTSQNDIVMTFATFKKIIEILPATIDWNGDFVLGANLTNANWRQELSEIVASSSGTIAFVNFEKLGLLKKESDIYLQNEREKVPVFLRHVEDAHLELEAKGQTTVMFTSADPSRTMSIGTPPKRCDVLVVRSELIDAMPNGVLSRYVEPNGVVIHIGRLALPLNLTLTTIDADVLEVSSEMDWVKSLSKFVQSNLNQTVTT